MARGGMGQVWEAEDTELRRTVALKLLLPELVDSRALDFFAREARAGGRLAHPNIVTTFACGEHHGLAWISQELIEGSWTLKDFIDEMRGEDTLPKGYYAHVAKLVAELADAIEAAHVAGVIHRDVKPANVLIAQDDTPKLADFGLARVTDESAMSISGDILGTWAYMSPEQLAAKRSAIDHRTDIFSLGVVLYELLTLRRPFEGDTTHQITEQVKNIDPLPAAQVRSHCPRELSLICAKALEKSPDSRYQSGADFAADLRNHLAGRVIQARAPNPFERLAKWVRCNPTAASVTAIGSLALGLVSVLLAINMRQSERNFRQSKENAGLAQANGLLAAEAQRERDDVLRLSAAQDLDDLLLEQARLWPPYPAAIPALQTWLQRGRELVAALPAHRAQLDELLEAGRASSSAARNNPGASRWWATQLSQLVAGLEALEAKLVEAGITSVEYGWSVGERLAFAEGLRLAWEDGGEHALLWQRDLPAIEAAYPGLKLKPQMGLIPLGPDPDSRLWEFAHLATGTPPRRGADGRLTLAEGTGVVLVLIPGGTFWMGAQSSDPEGRNYFPGAYPDEGPVHEVDVSAFFLSKYEMTQGQWLRCTGSNPSYHQPPNQFASTLLCPVEQLQWKQAVETCARLGLVLPTEAQWEYAARAGTQTPWCYGAEREDLRGMLNIADQTAAQAGAQWPDIEDWPDHIDGGVIYREVGSYPANRFGLHEVHGNISEWCRDHYDPEFYEQSPRQDPIGPDQGRPLHPRRGGGFVNAVSDTRSSFRDYESAEFGNYSLGLRPARLLD
jgi:serine/threonine protein kinase/formylglycine-generating enzyme required for sulfatase activity